MALIPGTGRSASVYIAKGANNNYSSEPMQEVNLSAYGVARYTVYEITDATKRYMNNDSTPTFASTGTIPTISRIEYCGGRVVFATAAGSSDTITCETGHYLTVSKFLGAANYSTSEGWKTEDYMLLGDVGMSTALLHKEWSATCEAYWANTQATLTTSGGNANSHITLTHEPGGVVGNTYDLVLVDPGGATAALSVSVLGTTITVSLARAASAITTTATQLVDALNCNAVRALGITAKIKATENGSGIVAALAHPNGHLTGGLDPVDYSSETGKVVLVLYLDDTGGDDQRREGYAVIQNFDPKITPGELVKRTITFKSYGPTGLYYRPS